ncbi:MAG: CAP domain-containing protein [Patescibacteria group bacterium]|nr:MAG: CAP domain-containing protein [Patescibacteria group bacterium]
MKIKLILVILFLAGLVFFWWWGSGTSPWSEENIFSGESSSSVGQMLEPLRLDRQEIVNSYFTVEGIMAESNKHRAKEGLSPLTLSPKLNEAAKLKVEDMFEYQYFEHISLKGDGPGDLAKKVDYDFLSVGENLALGNFKNDQELVDGWMNNPGHRANIMNPFYSEIGIAFGEGNFEDKKTWLIVQEFGLPSSVCPGPDKNDELLIERNKKEMERLEVELQEKKRALEETEPKYGEPYNTRVKEYNATADLFNQYVKQTKEIMDRYNASARRYNSCLKENTGN